MSAPPHLNGTVYQYRSRNHWKETWLCLEENGTLIWKRKDAYQVKGSSYLEAVIGGITIGGCAASAPTAKSTANKPQNIDNGNNGNGNGGASITPFVLHIPISTSKKPTVQKLAVKSSEDLNAWLDAFATIIGKWKLWKWCKRNEERKIMNARRSDESAISDNVLNLLNYQELVEFYSESWKEFLRRYQQEPDENIDNASGLSEPAVLGGGRAAANDSQNGHQQQPYQKHKRNNSDGGGAVAKQIGNTNANAGDQLEVAAPDQQKQTQSSKRNSDAYLETIEEDIHF